MHTQTQSKTSYYLGIMLPLAASREKMLFHSYDPSGDEIQYSNDLSKYFHHRRVKQKRGNVKLMFHTGQTGVCVFLSCSCSISH